jgi:hypothetical protein
MKSPSRGIAARLWREAIEAGRSAISANKVRRDSEQSVF